MKVLVFGGETIASLHNLRGARLYVKVSEDNLRRIISLGNTLAKSRNRYEVGNITKIIKQDFIIEEPYLLEMLYLSEGSKYITRIVKFDDDHYLMTDVDGIKWIIRKAFPALKDDIIFGPLLSHRQEPEEYVWFLNALHRDGTFIDVGANVGGYTIRACKMGARAIALEPDPDNYHVLKANLELNQCTGAHALNIAAGGKEEVRQLYQDDKASPSGYTLEKGEGRKVKCYVKVETLDAAITPLLGDEWVDLLKIDVEGSELEVIKGALNLLKRTRHVIVEVIPSTESKILKVLKLLRPMGFNLIDKVCRHSLYCDLFLSRYI
ncbi:MAG: FkbM family methyltransferase [Candidatus Bathyarchaeia archaeon]